MTIVQPHRARPQLGDEAASYVRDQITSGLLPAGAPVRPEAVAAELGISSTPAREALQALRAEGFLELAPRRGFTVARVTGTDIRDMFFAQSVIAGELAARTAALSTDEQVAQLTAIHQDLVSAAERGDMVALEELNHKFHRQINLNAQAPKLTHVLKIVSGYVPRRFYASIDGWSTTTMNDHDGVLEAIRDRDPERARRAMSEHVTRAGEQLAVHMDARIAETGDERA